MVSRFGGGTGVVQTSERARLFRGTPTQRPRPTSAPQPSEELKRRMEAEPSLEQQRAIKEYERELKPYLAYKETLEKYGPGFSSSYIIGKYGYNLTARQKQKYIFLIQGDAEEINKYELMQRKYESAKRKAAAEPQITSRPSDVFQPSEVSKAEQLVQQKSQGFRGEPQRRESIGGGYYKVGDQYFNPKPSDVFQPSEVSKAEQLVQQKSQGFRGEPQRRESIGGGYYKVGDQYFNPKGREVVLQSTAQGTVAIEVGTTKQKTDESKLRSGIGLSPKEYEQRQAALRTGIIQEKSGARILTASPLREEYVREETQQDVLNQIKSAQQYPGDAVIREVGRKQAPKKSFYEKFSEGNKPVTFSQAALTVFKSYEKVDTSVNQLFIPTEKSSKISQAFYAGRDATGGKTPGNIKFFIKPFDVAAEYTLRAGEYTTKGAEKVFNFKDIKIPITRQSAKELIAFTYISAGFAPLMKTAVAQQMAEQQEEYVEVIDMFTKQKRLVKKSDTMLKLQPRTSTKLEPITAEQASFIYKNLKLAEQIKTAKYILVKGTLAGKPVPRTIYDITRFLAESGISQKKSALILSKVAPKLFKQEKIIAQVTVGGLKQTPQYLIENLPKLKNLAALQTGIRGLQTKTLQSTKLEMKQMFKVIQIQKSLQLQRTTQLARQDSRQRTRTLQISKTLQLIKSIQLTKIIQDTKTETKQQTLVISIPKISQPTITKTGFGKPTTKRVAREPIYPPTKQPKEPFRALIKLPKPKISTQKFGLFQLFVRRRGKFKPIGKFKTELEAFKIGREITSKTLAATFKVTGGNGVSSVTPKGYYTKKNLKEGRLLIELPKYRLSTRTEIGEIQSYRRRKRK